MSGETHITWLEDMLRKASDRQARAERELEAATEDKAALSRVLEIHRADSEKSERSEADSDDTPKFSTSPQDNETLPTEEVVKSTANGHSQKVRYTQEVRDYLRQHEGIFQPSEVTTWLEEKYPHTHIRPATVSSIIWRMADRGQGVRKVQGVPGSENSYEKIPQYDAAQSGLVEQEHSVTEESYVNE